MKCNTVLKLVNCLNQRYFLLCCMSSDLRDAAILPVGIYLFKVNKRSFRKRCEICLKLTIKTPERRQWRHWRRSGVFIVNFEHISHHFQEFSVVNFEQVNAEWVVLLSLRFISFTNTNYDRFFMYSGFRLLVS